jgi:ABC-type molybdenum transport system ATPase subunit/photorepair protein PhrA
LVLPEINRESVSEDSSNSNDKKEIEMFNVSDESDNNAIIIHDGQFKWGDPPEIPMSANEKATKKREKNLREGKNSISIPKESVKKNVISRETLKNISLKIEKHSLTLIIGSIGSGKSSILSALIGDIEKLSGDIKINGIYF